MNEELHGFVKDLFVLIQEKYDASLAKEPAPESEIDVAYHQGISFAYYDVLDLIRSQLIAFGYNEEASALAAPQFGKT
jgi:hypothetical protein